MSRFQEVNQARLKVVQMKLTHQHFQVRKTGKLASTVSLERRVA